MKAKIKNMDLMKVKDNENTYYGFSQEWYKDIFIYYHNFYFL